MVNELMIWHLIRFHRVHRLPVYAHFKWRCRTCRRAYGLR